MYESKRGRSDAYHELMVSYDSRAVPPMIHHGDCLHVMPTFEANSIDAIVTDPPAGIAFMGKEWDKDKGGRDQWIQWMAAIAAEGLRVLKPGGHALVWSLPRTSHWTATAWENAGFELRDRLVHIFGSGFPKSLDVSKSIDKQAGVTRADVEWYDRYNGKIERYEEVRENGQLTGYRLVEIENPPAS